MVDKKLVLENRISLLKSRRKENIKIVKKLTRKLSKMSETPEECGSCKL